MEGSEFITEEERNAKIFEYQKYFNEEIDKIIDKALALDRGDISLLEEMETIPKTSYFALICYQEEKERLMGLRKETLNLIYDKLRDLGWDPDNPIIKGDVDNKKTYVESNVRVVNQRFNNIKTVTNTRAQNLIFSRETQPEFLYPSPSDYSLVKGKKAGSMKLYIDDIGNEFIQKLNLEGGKLGIMESNPVFCNAVFSSICNLIKDKCKDLLEKNERSFPEIERPFFTTMMVYKDMVNDYKINVLPPKIGDTISKAIETFEHVGIYIDYTEHMRIKEHNKNIPQHTYMSEEKMLYLKKDKAIMNGKLVYGWYVITVPALFEYAYNVNQFYSYDTTNLDVLSVNTIKSISIQTYLRNKIMTYSKKNVKNNCFSITYETIFKNCSIINDDRTQLKRDKDLVDKILNLMKNQGTFFNYRVIAGPKNERRYKIEIDRWNPKELEEEEKKTPYKKRNIKE